MDLSTIYTQLIMEHNKSAYNRKQMDNPDFRERGHNPSCGDDITIDIKLEERMFSEEIIEQFMLLSNEVIGSFMKKNNLPVIYRVHESPDIDKVLEMKEIIEGLGIKNSFLDNKKYQKYSRAAAGMNLSISSASRWPLI